MNAENYFAPPQEMVQRFQQYPQAIAAAEEICERCEVSLPLGRNLFPRFQVPAGFGSTGQLLHHLVWQGARERYGKITPEIRQRLDHELNIIEQLDVIDYFLVVWDIVAYARRHRIRCAGAARPLIQPLPTAWALPMSIPLAQSPFRTVPKP